MRSRPKWSSTIEKLEPRRLLSAVFPTADEQYMLELLNRARANPTGEAAADKIDLNEGVPPSETISSAPKQPLAINPFLTDSARSHSQWMIDNQTFSHYEGNGTIGPNDRMQAAGYVFTSPYGYGENIAFRGTKPAVPPVTQTVALEHQDLFVDSTEPDRGHRVNMMNPNFEEVGVGVATGVFETFNAVMTTQDFAYTAGSGPFLTGVAYTDAVVHDHFYTPREGLGGVAVTATRDSDGMTFQTTTWSSGGYSLQVPAGTYTVTAFGSGITFPVIDTGVVVGAQNVKLDFLPATGPVVVDRYIVYNHSVFDGNTTGPTAADDNAIATDKSALLPGHTATFANYTSYSKGINGIIVDLANLPTGAAPTVADFTFKIGNDNNPSGWVNAAAPSGILVRPGKGVAGSTRVEITWADGAIRKKWLQVTVLADSVTALASPDVFYFGNAVGDSGNDPSNALVNSTDEIAARSDPHNFRKPAGITNPHDYNRDGRVDATDQLIARNNATTTSTDVNLISVPGAPTAATSPLTAVAVSSDSSASAPDHHRRRHLRTQ